MSIDTLDRLGELKTLLQEYELKIKEKQDLLRNLENRVIDANRRLEAKEGEQAKEIMIERSQLQAEYQKKHNDLEARESELELKLLEISNNRRNLDAAEEDYVKRNSQLKAIDLERRDIYFKREKLQEEIDKNTILLSQIKGIRQEIENKEKGFENREKAILVEEERIDKKRGMLLAAQEEFEAEKNNILSLKKLWEEEHGKLGANVKSERGSREATNPKGNSRNESGQSKESVKS